MQQQLEHPLIILYGSQTGNSQDLAERIWRQVKHKGYKNTQLSSFDKFDINKLLNNDENTIVTLICVCSTCGQGDVPDNMLKFWRSIMRKNLPSGFLDGLRYSCIGLGDSSYDKYNFTAKKLHKRLLQLGARPILDLCLCDEQQSDATEGGFSKWVKSFWGSEVNKIMLSDKGSIIAKYKIVYLNELEERRSGESSENVANEVDLFYGRLIKNERQTCKDHWQDVRLIEIDCNNSGRVKYECGDVLVMRPSNLKTNIDRFLQTFEHLKLDLNQPIQIESNFGNDEFEPETEISLVKTVGDLIDHYFDINSVPRMSFFELFGQLADDELEKEKLDEFMTTADGLQDLYNYCYRPRRTIIEIFLDFPKTTRNISRLEQLLDLVPSIKPRSFSIASSPWVHKDKIQLLVAIVEYKTRLYESRKGTCSYWLSSLEVGSKIPFWIKKGSFQIDLEKPVICIGPGTGVAPFRSIINERVHRRHDLCGNNYLYFGCRSKSMDFYFEKEWYEMQESGHLRIYPAFSRDQMEKIYVQDVMWKNREEVFDLIDERMCYVLIAGNAKRMPQDVMAFLEKIVVEGLRRKKNLAVEEEEEEDMTQLAKEYIRNLEIQKRIQLETWS